MAERSDRAADRGRHRRPPPAPVPRLAAASVLGLGLALWGCGDAASRTSAPPAVSSTVPPVASSPTPTTAVPPASDAPGQPTTLDPSLLAILPERVAGLAIQPSPDAEALLDDADLARSAAAVAVGIVAGGDPPGSDLAVSTVVRLRPGVYSAAFYDDWRADYDRAACEPAAGVADHDQQDLGGHRVDITVCSGGARTYHTHLDGDILVSVTAVGDQDFGDLVMAGLRG